MWGACHHTKLSASVTRWETPDIYTCSHSLFISVGYAISRHSYSIHIAVFVVSNWNKPFFNGTWSFCTQFVACTADWMATFYAWALYGWDSRQFHEYDDDLSAVENMILVPQLIYKNANCNSKDCAGAAIARWQEGDSLLLQDVQWKSWPPPWRLLQALPYHAQVPLTV